MKFMTPASVQNLPRYLAEDRQRSLLQREEERYTKGQQEKKMVAQFGMELMSVLDSGGDVKAGLDGLKQKYAGKMTPDMMQLTSNMVQRFKQEQIAQEDRQKQNVLETTGLADADAASRILGQKAGLMGPDSAGGDEYSVPVSQQDLLLSMSPRGRLGMTESLLGRQDKEAERAQQAKMDQSLLDYRAAQTEQLGKPKQTEAPTSFREWQLAVQNGHKGTYEQWVKGDKGSITPGSSEYNLKKLEHIADAEKNNLTGEDPAKLKAMAATEFDAMMQGWQKVHDPETGRMGYSTPQGIVDVYGNPVEAAPDAPPPGPDPDKGGGKAEGQGLNFGGDLPSITDNDQFRGNMGSLLGKYGVNESKAVKDALKITKGGFNPENGTIIFKPQNESHMKKVFIELSNSGIKFDAKQNEDGTISVSVVDEGKPLVKVGK
jgi:hypothetical protein